MPLVDSRLGPGTLKFGTQDISYQASNVRLVPDVSEDDGTATLAEPEPAPLATVAWSLEGTVIQDFTAGDAAFVNWLMDNALTESAFEFVPATTDGPTYTGTVQVRPVEVGGDAGTQVTTDFSMPIVGPISRTDPVTGEVRIVGRAPESAPAPAKSGSK